MCKVWSWRTHSAFELLMGRGCLLKAGLNTSWCQMDEVDQFCSYWWDSKQAPKSWYWNIFFLFCLELASVTADKKYQSRLGRNCRCPVTVCSQTLGQPTYTVIMGFSILCVYKPMTHLYKVYTVSTQLLKLSQKSCLSNGTTDRYKQRNTKGPVRKIHLSVYHFNYTFRIIVV